MISLKELQSLFPNSAGNTMRSSIEKMMYDSRNELKNSLFVPFIGEKHDAHKYIGGAIKNGAIAALWNEKHSVPVEFEQQCMFFIVEDTEKALQKLASYYRDLINPIVIGITGSNGKTTTKDLVSSVLETKFNTHKTAGNFNNHIGMPMTILHMPANTEVLVLEMGMNNFNEIDLLSRLAKPDYAIITNIGESHIEFLGSREGISRAKLEIIHGLKEDGQLIIDGDEILLEPMKGKSNVISCGFKQSGVEYFIEQIKISGKTTEFQVNGHGYHIPLLGAHHAKNATFALIIAENLGICQEDIQRGFDQLKYSQMRFEWVTGKNGVTLINDAYNASPTSMIAAINVMKQMGDFSRKIVVLGDILELGENAAQFHRDVATTIDESINIVFTIGENARIISEYVQDQFQGIKSKHFINKEDIARELQHYLQADTVILFKASRGMALEEIIAPLCTE